MADDMNTEKMEIVSILQTYYAMCLNGCSIKEVVEVITQGKHWKRDLQILIADRKNLMFGVESQYAVGENVIWKLLKSKVQDPVPWLNLYDPIWIAYIFRDIKLLWLLLKHNVGCIRKMEDVPKLKPLKLIIERCLYSNTPYEIMDFLTKLGDYSSQSRRRLQVVLWGLDTMSSWEEDIVTSKNDSEQRLKVMFLTILFEFVPEPYISSAEIGDVVKHIIGNQNGAEDFVFKARKKFETVYPESMLPYQPRSLKHLSRCCILKKLRRSGRFPQGVDQLPVPEFLKDYIFPRNCLDIHTERGILTEGGNFVHSESDVICSEVLKINLLSKEFSVLK